MGGGRIADPSGRGLIPSGPSHRRELASSSEMADTETRERYKQQAAERSVEFLASGMVVGLGTGSTAAVVLERIALLVRNGTLVDILGIPTSSATETRARALGIPLTTLDQHPAVDVTIDGADEVDPHLNLIKGGGGAFLREKVVAQASAREIIVVDDEKLSPALGSTHPLPVEVVPFAKRPVEEFLRSLGSTPILRPGRDGAPYRTDQGNVILDCSFGPITDPEGLAAQLRSRAGIVEHGLFLGLATDLVAAGASGVEVRTRG